MSFRLTFFFAFISLLDAARGELAPKTTGSYGDNVNNLIALLLLGVLVDWLRMKLKITIQSTEKLGCADKNVSVEKNIKGFEPSKLPETTSQLVKDAKEEDATNEEVEKPTEANKEEKKQAEKKTAEPETEVMAEKIILSASQCLSTHNLEPAKAPQLVVEKQLVSWDFEEFQPNPNNSRPRSTGLEQRWATETEPQSNVEIGERTPESTPERTPESKPVYHFDKNFSQDIPALQAPGSTTQTISEDWLVDEEKVNERKPMVFIGGVSASTTPMECVHELKKQGFNVTVVPRIRYGVSFGFCPDLVLSSAEEVETMLAMKKIWIKDRWIDVRPYVPKDEESASSASSSPSTRIVKAEVEEPSPIPTETSPTTKTPQNVQEVNANVFADTCNVSMNAQTSHSPSPNQIPEQFIQEIPQMQMFNGFDCAYVDHLNMSPPGSLCSTPTFVPSHTIPATMMFPMPIYSPQLPAEFVYAEMPHQPITPIQQPVPYNQHPVEQQYC